MSEVDRRAVLTSALVGGAALAGAQSALAKPAELVVADVKKEADIACLYHCDFGDDKRYDDMLRNINNHMSVYSFDSSSVKIVIVAHSVGIKYHLKTLAGTPWANHTPISDEMTERMRALAKYGVEVYLCKITFERNKLDLSLARDEPYIKLVPSGVATVAALQAKGFGYLKVG